MKDRQHLDRYEEKSIPDMGTACPKMPGLEEHSIGNKGEIFLPSLKECISMSRCPDLVDKILELLFF